MPTSHDCETRAAQRRRLLSGRKKSALSGSKTSTMVDRRCIRQGFVMANAEIGADDMLCRTHLSLGFQKPGGC